MTILSVMPLQQEIDPFCEALVARGVVVTPMILGWLEAAHVAELGLIIARGGHGKTQFGIQTQYLLDQLPDIEAVLCMGAAGALNPELAIGDIVVAAATIEHDYTARFRPHPLPRFPGDVGFIDQIQHLPLNALPFGIRFAVVASGDEDVIEIERAAALRHTTEACAVAWEGAGGARAARFNQLPFLELRAITDTADHHAPDAFARNLAQAMMNLAMLIMLWRDQRRG